MAQQLTAVGHRVALLAIIDQRRPNLDPSVAWKPASLVHFLMNLPPWLWYDCLASGPRDLFSRLGRKLARAFRGRAARGGGPDVADAVDVNQFPVQYHRLLEANYRALRGYVPRPWSGPLAIFRARAQPLCRWHESNWVGATSPPGRGASATSRGRTTASSPSRTSACWRRNWPPV
jgi:hypothetical protein